MRSKDVLEEWTGQSVRAFAYPAGLHGQDYTADTVKLPQEQGFDFAFTPARGFARPEEPPLEGSRSLMLSRVSPAELTHRLAYSWRG